MAPIFEQAAAMIGNSPLVHTANIAPQIYAKLECANPAGSAKDRAVYQMILAAEQAGQLKPGATIIEPTSGNTGIALASIAVPRGYRVVLTMPETMSLERRRLIAAYGAEIVLTDGKLGMQGAVERAQALVAADSQAVLLGQFQNPANPQAHYHTTGPEIWRDTQGKVDVLVAGVGTGGTISGAGKFLKEQNPNLEVIAVEPAESPLLSKGVAGPHGIQGIGANFVPQTLDCTIYDQVVCVKTEDAKKMMRQIAVKEGLLVGISSGAAMYAADYLAQQPKYQHKMIVVVLPDTGERYLSTGVFDAESV